MAAYGPSSYGKSRLVNVCFLVEKRPIADIPRLNKNHKPFSVY
jgi:hypothetical protein